METSPPLNQTFLRRLRHLALIEGTSTLLLFGVAMPLKYVWDMPMAVRIVGSLHGLLFVALVLMSALAVRRVPIGLKLGLACVLGAVVPFGPFVVDRWLVRLPLLPDIALRECDASAARRLGRRGDKGPW
jgi:integral membrane protein